MLSVMERMEVLTHADSLVQARNYQALKLMLKELDPASLETDPILLYYRLLSATQLGDVAEASEFRSQTAEVFSRHQDSRIYRRYLNVTGIILTHSGKLIEAHNAFSDAYSRAVSWNDVLLMADATMNIGVICDIQGKWAEALVAQTRALALFESVGDSAMAAGCHHNMGMTYRQLNRYYEARKEFDIALDIYQLRRMHRDAASSAIEKSILYTMIGEPELAEAMAKSVYNDVRGMNNRRLIGEAQRALAIAHRATGRLRRSLRYYTLAHENAILTNNILLEAETAEELAGLRRRLGNEEISIAMAARAVQIYTKLGSSWRASRVQRFLEG